VIRAVAFTLRLGAGLALAAAVVIAGREIWRNHEGWAVDALGWAALLYGAQVAMLAVGWHWLGEGTWPGRGRRVWLRAFVHGWVARYLPGPPTGPAGKYLALRDAGAEAPAIAALLWVEQVLQLAASIAVPAALVLPAFGPGWWWASAGGLAAAAALALGGAQPGLVRRLSGRFGPRGERSGVSVAPGTALLSFGAMAAAALLAGLAFHVVAVVVSPWPLSRWEEGVAVFALASLAGYVTPFAPSGAGVRESVIVALLGGELGAATALTVAVVARATAVLVDAVVAASYFGAGRIGRGLARRASAATLSNRRA
jgi:hypothetical protein